MSKRKNNSGFSLFTTGLILIGAITLLRNKAVKVAGIGAISTKFFDITGDTGIDELKKQYYKLAKIHHPDTGGTNEAFRSMNNEYELLQSIILQKGNFTATEKTNEQNISEIYREIIDSLITIPGIIIELIGSWIWISGNTFPVKEQIKAAGFKFHSTKKMWFWYPGEYKKFNNKEMDIEDIRKHYGSETFKSKDKSYKLSGLDTLTSKLLKLQKLLISRENLNTDISNQN
jgi:curved DNA-binding protein CbpA